MKRAKIIVIEGTDGSGKETQSKKLYEHYKRLGLKVALYSFPVYNSSTGKIVGGPYLGKDEICSSYFEETAPKVDPLVSSLYYAADRRYNFLMEIENELYKNDIVILDRYTTSNMGHQASKCGNDKEFNKIISFIETLEYDLCELPRPDVVMFLHMPALATTDLRKNRANADDNERDKNHISKAEKTYVKLAKEKKWIYINCIKGKKYKSVNDIRSVDEIHLDIVDKLNKVINRKSSKITKMSRFKYLGKK